MTNYCKYKNCRSLDSYATCSICCEALCSKHFQLHIDQTQHVTYEFTMPGISELLKLPGCIICGEEDITKLLYAPESLMIMTPCAACAQNPRYKIKKEAKPLTSHIKQLFSLASPVPSTVECGENALLLPFALALIKLFFKDSQIIDVPDQDDPSALHYVHKAALDSEKYSGFCESIDELIKIAAKAPSVSYRTEAGELIETSVKENEISMSQYSLVNGPKVYRFDQKALNCVMNMDPSQYRIGLTLDQMRPDWMIPHQFYDPEVFAQSTAAFQALDGAPLSQLLLVTDAEAPGLTPLTWNAQPFAVTQAEEDDETIAFNKLVGDRAARIVVAHGSDEVAFTAPWVKLFANDEADANALQLGYRQFFQRLEDNCDRLTSKRPLMIKKLVGKVEGNAAIPSDGVRSFIAQTLKINEEEVQPLSASGLITFRVPAQKTRAEQEMFVSHFITTITVDIANLPEAIMTNIKTMIEWFGFFVQRCNFLVANQNLLEVNIRGIPAATIFVARLKGILSYCRNRIPASVIPIVFQMQPDVINQINSIIAYQKLRISFNGTHFQGDEAAAEQFLSTFQKSMLQIPQFFVYFKANARVVKAFLKMEQNATYSDGGFLVTYVGANDAQKNETCSKLNKLAEITYGETVLGAMHKKLVAGQQYEFVE